MKGLTISVHEHGFIRVVDYMGDDSAIVQAARVSYGAGTKTVSEDQALINYLMRHRHTTPFEMCEIKLHLKMPIFVARQWIRHRTANVNEYSARYSTVKEEFYVPSPQDVAAQSTNNKQGRGDTFPPDEAERITDEIRCAAKDSFAAYNWFLEEDVARELSRTVLPLSTYTEFYWKIDLHNLLHFLKLRMDPHAQKEIRDYANRIGVIVKGWVPQTWEAFDNYVLNSFTLSRDMVRYVSDRLNDCCDDIKSYNLTERELGELSAALG